MLLYVCVGSRDQEVDISVRMYIGLGVSCVDSNLVGIMDAITVYTTKLHKDMVPIAGSALLCAT